MTNPPIHREPNPAWNCADDFRRAWYFEKRAMLAERILSHALNGKEIGRAHHIKDLEEKNWQLKQTIGIMQDALHDRNLELRGRKRNDEADQTDANPVPVAASDSP